MNDILDSDYYNVNKILIKYCLYLMLSLIIIIAILILVVKKRYYQNLIYYVNDKKISIIVDTNNLNKVKNNKYITIDGVDYKYNIDKIEKKDNFYIVTIDMSLNLKSNSETYKILLEKENLLQYLIRIIRGGI